MPGKVVVDANVIISSLINKGICFSALASNAVLKKFELIAPEYLVDEIKKHESDILKYSNLAKRVFDEAFAFLVQEISFIPAEEFLNFLPQAKEIAPHLKDAPYVALALATDSPILSDDKGLRKSKLKVISPREFLEILLRL